MSDFLSKSFLEYIIVRINMLFFNYLINEVVIYELNCILFIKNFYVKYRY